MRPPVELSVDEEGAQAAGICLGLESLTTMRRSCTLTALDDSFLLQFPLEATNSLLVEDTSRIFQMFVENEIRSLHLLQGLSQDMLHAVVPMFELLELPVAQRSVSPPRRVGLSSLSVSPRCLALTRWRRPPSSRRETLATLSTSW